MKNLSQELDALSPGKRELVELLLRESRHGRRNTGQMTRIPRRQTTALVPLSFSQERMWFLSQMDPDDSSFRSSSVIRLEGTLRMCVLERSLNEIVWRHEILRTRFVDVEGRPVQVVAPVRALVLPTIDLEGLPQTEREQEAQRLVTGETKQLLDPGQGRSFCPTLLRTGDKEWMLLLTMHHIVFDGWSIGVFLRELATLYRAFSAGMPSPLPELPIQYADFCLWQREQMQAGILDAQLDYWEHQLGRIPPNLQLPTDQVWSVNHRFTWACARWTLAGDLVEALQELGLQEGVTTFVTLLAALKTLLYRYSGQDDIIVGSVTANRHRPELESLIGVFINILALRTGLSGNPVFQDLLGRVHHTFLEAYANQDLPFERLVQVLQPERRLGQTPLLKVLFVFQNFPTPVIELPGLRLSLSEGDGRIPDFDLSLSMWTSPEGLAASFEYNANLFMATTIRRMVGHFQVLVERLGVDPAQHISDIPILTDAERHQLLVEWNDTEGAYPEGACIHELFEVQVERIPDAVAVILKDRHLTYRELNRYANQVARRLQRMGVEPEAPVGVCMERSLEMVVGLLSILKAGGAYVPLDPAYPRERLAFMLEDAQIAVLLTQQHLMKRLSDHKARVVCLDLDQVAITEEDRENCTTGVMAENLAYVIYTSGSMGRPKGVAIEHRSAVALLSWGRKLLPPALFDGMLASTSICFDLSVFELFMPLSCGGKLILSETALHLPHLPAAQAVTVVNTVPSAMKELVRVDGIPGSVHTINLAGEPLSTRLVQQIYEQETIRRVFDLYGPTEDTTYSTYALRSASGPATIGRPIANTRIYLLDQHLHPVPIGVPGEIYMGGAGLARGYINRPSLTAERFAPNPFDGKVGTRLYRTGDLARYLPDGNIEFLGRIDNQVKIHGYRIELGEIEAVLGQHPMVRETIALAREDDPGDKRLVAYVVPDRKHQPTPDELGRFLRQKLPEYMVPLSFVTLDAMPLMPNGKVDRQALPAPDRDRSDLGEAFVAPRTPIEEILAGIWTDLLDVERVGVYDNFFQLGGHSLLVPQLVFRLQKVFPTDVTLRLLFEAQTIAELAVLIEEMLLEKVEEMSEEEARNLVSDTSS